MAKFDRVDGVFVSTACNYDEREKFKKAGWVWSPARKQWRTPDIEKARLVGGWAVGTAKIHIDTANMLQEKIVAASWAEDSDVEHPAPEGLNYLPFQKAGIDYALERAHTLIADPPGLGKTVMAVGVHNASRRAKVLVVPPASLKLNWEREWLRWDVHGLSVGIAKSIPKTKTEQGFTRSWTEYDWPDTDVVIINYDMLPTFDEQIKSIVWDLAIFDEAHLLKTPTALRTLCVFGGTKKARRKDGKIIEQKRDFQPIQARKHLYLTGTPILSKPSELWMFVKACDPEGLGKNGRKFREEFCDAHEDMAGRLIDTGASNLPKLNRLLRERFMVRRDKRAVLKELPDKTREVILFPKDKLEIPVKKELSRVEKALEQYEKTLGIDTSSLFRYIDDITDKLGEALDAQDSDNLDWEEAIATLSAPEFLIFTEMSAAREEVALAKVGLVVDHVQKLVSSGEPVVCFAYHKSVIKSIAERLEKAGITVGVITGNVPVHKRQQIVDDYQAGKLDVILGNIIAMGVGWTLTIGRFVVIAELDWVPAMLEQAEDRAWRIGQDCAVLVQYLLVDGSIEASMSIRLIEKMQIISKALN